MFFLKKTSSKLIECKSKSYTFLKNRIRIESARVRGSNEDGRDVFFSRFLKMAKDSAARIESIPRHP